MPNLTETNDSTWIIEKISNERDFYSLGRTIVTFDFDGVIHPYINGWEGIDVIPDPPSSKILTLLEDFHAMYGIAINSCRAMYPKGYAAIEAYCSKYSIPYDIITISKPPSKLYIDDRCVKYDGTDIEKSIQHIKDSLFGIEQEQFS